MKKLLLYIILLLSACTSFASDQYKGYIVLLNRDTVHGFIIVDKPQTLHWEVSFLDSTEATHTYTPGKIAGFGIYVDEFWRRYVIIDVGEPANPANDNSLVFARVLQDDGVVKLFEYSCYQRQPGYYRNDIYVPGERMMVKEICLVKENNDLLRLQQHSSIFNRNKKQLRDFFSDCKAAVSQVEKSRDLWDDLPSMVRAYNRCRKNKS